MKNILKLIFVSLVMFVMSCSFICDSVNAAAPASVKPAVVNYIEVCPLDIVANPDFYLNKDVTFTAEYVSFSALGLDYKPAFRDSQKYIGILIKRPDVISNIIPLSEMKIFVSRDIAEKHLDIEPKDIIKLSGNVFSTALGDPWFDVKEFTVVKSSAKSAKK